MTESIDNIVEHAEVVVIGNSDPDFRNVPELLSDQQHIVDLVRIRDDASQGSSYDGICW